jgi:hypothetical protein
MTVLAFGNCEGSGTIVDYSCVCIAVGGNEITAAVFYFAATSAWCSLGFVAGNVGHWKYLLLLAT